jgi:integrase
VPRLPKLQYVKFVRAKGTVYGYFDTGKKDAAGKRIYAPLGKHASVGFGDSYAAMLGHRKRREAVPNTVADLADRFEESAEFARLSLGTRKFYKSLLKHVRAELGEFPIADVKRKHIAEVVHNRLGERNGTRNGFLAVYGVLHSYAQSLDLVDTISPTKHVKPFKTGEHEPWPEDILQAGLRAEHDRTRLAIALLYYTGQRIGDAVQFRWNDIRDGVLSFTQQKTGKAMDVPLHSDLLAELKRTPKRGITIIVNQDGQSMTPQVIRRELKKFAADHGAALVPHGLRKNAVNALLEAGCTDYEVQAITGQSLQMIAHYARKVNRKKLGKAAILKLENKAGKFKPSRKPGLKPA